MKIFEIKPDLGEGIAEEIKYHFQGNVTDLTPAEMRFFYRFLFESADGFCDHSVNVCACSTKRVLQGMAEVAGFPPNEHDYNFPNPDEFDKLVVTE